LFVGRYDKTLARMRSAPHDVPFDDVVKICTTIFGAPRSKGTSHVVFKMPWAGDPRVNIQRTGNGKAKTYQVRQVVEAIHKMTEGGSDNG
jgi:hypothetical protein